MNSLEERVEIIENSHIKILYSEIEKAFSKVWLPSHDLEHHKRVWFYAKEILFCYSKSGSSISDEFIKALMIAVFFHDVGLTVTLDVEHGKESAERAKDFLKRYPEMRIQNEQEMLNAIEKHDDKEYLNPEFNYTNKPSLYSILTVADDLDAFGAIGMYRYIEIYFLRGIDNKNILESINKNLDRRFRFVSKVLMFDQRLHEKQLKRYIDVKEYIKSFSMADVEAITRFISTKSEINIAQLNTTKRSNNLDVFLQGINKELNVYSGI